MRQAVVYGTLFITLGLSVWGSLTPAEELDPAMGVTASGAKQASSRVAVEDSSVVAPASTAGPDSAPPRAHDALALHRGILPVAQGEGAFGVRVWKAHSESSLHAPPTPPAVQIVPSAPPLPFSFLGKLDVGDGRQRFYVLKGDTQFTISPGDVFDGIYQFEGVNDGQLVILYKPLSVRQTLPINR